MNNDAFRALVNKQQKSTKEIAREAVEDEFQKKRQRRGGGGGRRGRRGNDDGYGSDSGGSSDEDARGRLSGRGRDGSAEQEEKTNEPEWKRRRREKKKEDGSGASEYRDRARERREGKSNLDYASLEGLAAQSGEDVDRRRQAELSKYLGGDEEHTHLVRGLDKALAEKVRREEMGQTKESADLDELLEDAYAQKSKKGEDWQDWQHSKPKTELGKSILKYLLRKKRSDGSATAASTAAMATQIANLQVKTNPTVQKSIQRSILNFSLESDVRQRKNAWQVPGISVRASGTWEEPSGDATSRKMTPLNKYMIATIAKKLDGGAEKGNKDLHAYANGGENKNGETTTSKGNNDANIKNVKDETEVNGTSMHKDDDSDDDIFEDAGAYVPEALGHNITEHSSTEDVPKQTKQQSIFDNLIPDTATAAPTNIPKPQQQQLQPHTEQHQNNMNVIDRDIFGGKSSSSEQPYQKRRGPQTAAMEGVSMSDYQGCYGEEMDVDFGGNDDDDRRQKGKDDKEKEDSGDVADDGDEED